MFMIYREVERVRASGPPYSVSDACRIIAKRGGLKLLDADGRVASEIKAVLVIRSRYVEAARYLRSARDNGTTFTFGSGSTLDGGKLVATEIKLPVFRR